MAVLGMHTAAAQLHHARRLRARRSTRYRCRCCQCVPVGVSTR
jgi:hypothetical protein